MSNKYLVVADADKIQDLLFRSSKLREVAGGSQMLDEFCEEKVPKLIETLGGKRIISAGGTFRILFDSPKKAEEFGEYLSEFYRRELGGTITVAEPVEVTSEQNAIKQAQVHLGKAKHTGKPPVSIEQIPHMAICASCGIGIAYYYEKPPYPNEKENYLCEVCHNKTEARGKINEIFLRDFLDYISKGSRETDFEIQDVDEIAKIESRKYVAYIVADVNNMGTIFSSCNSFSQLENLSNKLKNVINESLAEPTKILLENQRKHLKESSENLIFVPVLPLILAGDDVFMLSPAQWGLDFSLKFCEQFEKKMNKTLKEIGIKTKDPLTISVSVIICKGKFPYLVAHELGEKLLKAAKKRANKEKRSIVAFTIVTGNELVITQEKEKKIVAGFPAYTLEELKKLIKYRYSLKDLPGTRRTQIEDLFLRVEKLEGTLSKLGEKLEFEWIPERDLILKRLDDVLRKTVEIALSELGESKEKHNWLLFEGEYYCHQLPDLLRAWDFAYDLGFNTSKYEEGEK